MKEDEEEVVEGKRTTYGGSKESESVAVDVIIVALHIPFWKWQYLAVNDNSTFLLFCVSHSNRELLFAIFFF